MCKRNDYPPYDPPAEVWCEKCERPASQSYLIRLPSGAVERVFRCVRHGQAARA